MDEAPQMADIQRGYRIMFCFINVLETSSRTIWPLVFLSIRPENEDIHLTIPYKWHYSGVPTMLIAYSRARLNINIMNCIHKDNIAFKNPHELNCPRIV